MSLVRNEQTKLTATFLNGVGIAVFAVGGLAPFLSSFYTSGGPTPFHLVVGGVCFFIAAGLHLLARHLLRRLVP